MESCSDVLKPEEPEQLHMQTATLLPQPIHGKPLDVRGLHTRQLSVLAEQHPRFHINHGQPSLELSVFASPDRSE